MVRSWLRDDPLCALPPDDGLVGRVGVVLDGDCCDVGGVSTGGGDGDPDTPVVDNPQQQVIIRARERTGYDEDGNPRFEWTTLVEGPAYWSSERSEFDHIAGMTLVKAKATVEYGGPARVFETAVLKRVSDGTVWRVVSTEQPYGRVELDLRRIEQDSPDDTEVELGKRWVEYVDNGDGTFTINGSRVNVTADGIVELGD